MNASERRLRVRRWLAGQRCVYTPNVWDPMSARVAEDVGFELGLLSAHGAEWAINGGNEMCRVTITELADVCRRIYRATELSILVTGPWGFGNAINDARYVEELELAGASIITIGDIALPLGFRSAAEIRPLDTADHERRRQPLDPGVASAGHDYDIDLQPAVPLNEYVGRVKAALAARRDPSLVIAARTNALMVGDISAALDRMKAYEAAGVEAVWFSSPSRSGIEAVRAATTIPLIVGGSVWNEWSGSVQEIRACLDQIGVRVASVGSVNLRAVARTLVESFIAMRDGDRAHLTEMAIPKADFERITHLARDNEMVGAFLN